MKLVLNLIIAICISLSAFNQNLVKINECVIEKGQLKNLVIDYNPATGDRTIVVNGVRKPFEEVYPKKSAEYAGGSDWYINNELVKVNGKVYVKYGLPRILGVDEIKKSAVYKGVNIYTETSAEAPYEVIYIPSQQGCEFQPYQVYCGKVKIEQVSADANTIVLKVKAEDLKGKVRYNWDISYGTIKSGQGTDKIVIDIKQLKKYDTIFVNLKATSSENCSVYADHRISVMK